MPQECLPLGEMSKYTEEAEPPGVVQSDQPGEEKAFTILGLFTLRFVQTAALTESPRHGRGFPMWAPTIRSISGIAADPFRRVKPSACHGRAKEVRREIVSPPCACLAAGALDP